MKKVVVFNNSPQLLVIPGIEAVSLARGESREIEVSDEGLEAIKRFVQRGYVSISLVPDAPKARSRAAKAEDVPAEMP